MKVSIDVLHWVCSIVRQEIPRVDTAKSQYLLIVPDYDTRSQVVYILGVIKEATQIHFRVAKVYDKTLVGSRFSGYSSYGQPGVSEDSRYHTWLRIYVIANLRED